MLGAPHLLGTGMHSRQLAFAQVVTYLNLTSLSRMVVAVFGHEKFSPI
jgi:hypothetical protein